MNDNQYNTLKSEIILKYGNPEYDLGVPQNESAVKLTELKNKQIEEKNEARRVQENIDKAKRVKVHEDSPEMEIPERLIKDSWLTPFDEEEKEIIFQWLKDITQSVAELSRKTGLKPHRIRKVMNSESFKYLEANLSQAYKKVMSLEAMNRLRRCLHSKDERSVLTAAKLILLDAGLLKPDVTDVNVKETKEIVLDPATLEKFRQLGDDVLDLNNETKDQSSD